MNDARCSCKKNVCLKGSVTDRIDIVEGTLVACSGGLMVIGMI